MFVVFEYLLNEELLDGIRLHIAAERARRFDEFVASEALGQGAAAA